ncbi:MAG: transglutaminase domain-containing protein [Lachnospirales bacterium]
MKKLITLVLSVLFTIGLYSFAFAGVTPSLESAVKTAVYECKTEIDISNYNVDPESALRVYFELHNTDPDFAYADNNARCEYVDNRARKLYFTYKGTAAEIARRKSAVNDEVNKIVAQASKGGSDVEKIKIIHDYVIKNTSYNYETTDSSPYELLINKKGTCLSYALSFKLIMNKMNIPCYIARSVAMGHAWNVAKIGDNWFNIDLTYDATTFAQIKSVSYANSLKSDGYFKTVGYRDWQVNSSVSCTDSSYDSLM